MTTLSSSKRGFTLIEILVALTILGVALLAMSGLWYITYGQTAESADLGSGYSIARQEIEKAKAISFYYLPEASWTAYYTQKGVPHTGQTGAHFRANTQVTTVKDTNYDGQPEALAAGELPNTGHLRLVTVVVTALERPNKKVFETKTYLVRGGF